MMHSPSGKTGVTVIITIAALALGAILGAEIVKRFYFSPATTVSTTVATASTPDSNQQNVSINGPDGIDMSRRNAIVTATNRVAPSVVGIVVTQITQEQGNILYDEFFGAFFLQPPRVKRVENMGSGFVFNKDGLILTNYHVVENAQRLYVNFPDGKKFEATIVGVDPPTDLAVLKVAATGLTSIRLGNSDNVMIGEWAIAIGNPFLDFINDVHPTVTVGVISAINRNVKLSQTEYYHDMLQTDAAINPGNSGGPLIDANGEAVGINTYIYTTSPYKVPVGIGFAIPINKAKSVVRELISYGGRRKVWPGFHVQELTPQVAMTLGYTGETGVIVSDVQKNGAGEQAGLMPGDIITQMDNHFIGSTADIESAFADYFVGDPVTFVCMRKNRQVTVRITLPEAPKRPVSNRNQQPE